MGHIIEELQDGYRLVTDSDDEDQYYVVTPDWTRCTATFDEILDVTPTSVTFVRDGHDFKAFYDSGCWWQKCFVDDDEQLYCGDVACRRHPAYDASVVGSLPDLRANEYGDWHPPFTARVRLALRRLFPTTRQSPSGRG